MTSAISWLNRSGFKPEVWNLVTGCSKVSAGCSNCYAERLALRYHWTDFPWTAAHAAQNITIHDDPLRDDRFSKPMRWKSPRMIFVNSMSDLFHELVPVEVIRRAFRIMLDCPQHIFIILTKRPERHLDLDIAEPWADNIWLGVSIEDQRSLNRIDALRQHPASVRVLSCEPLLSALPALDLREIDWVICGGESGPKARPMEMDWARNLRDQCVAAQVAFYFKQTGGLRPGTGEELIEVDGSRWQWRQWPGEMNPPVRMDIPQKSVPKPVCVTPSFAPAQLSLFDPPEDVGDTAAFQQYLRSF